MSTIDVGAGITERELELSACGLRQQAELLASGETTPAELVELSLSRIEATQSTLNAFRVVCAEEARAAASEAGERLGRGERRPCSGSRWRSRTTSTWPGTPPPSAAAASTGRPARTPRW